MDLVTGALPSALGKLGELLLAEYNLQKEAKNGIMFLREELEAIEAALKHISKLSVDELKDGDKVWARNVRELSYDIDDSIDIFMVSCKGDKKAEQQGFVDKMLDKLRQPMIRRKFAKELRNLKNRVEDVSQRHERYKIDNDAAKTVKIDPRLWALHEKERALVGIDEARDDLIQLLMEGDTASKKQNRIVSVVGFGGLGKTTLAKVVYEKIRPQFDCSAFITVSQTPNMETLLKDIKDQLSKENTTASINVVIEQLKAFLHEKRYLIVIDDIWDIQHWETIRCAFPDNDFGCKIITTRISNVAEKVGGAYNMRPLSPDNSRILLYRRIFGTGDEGKCSDGELNELFNRILKKCAGVPLAIITIASLLANQGRNKWYEVYNSISTHMENSLDLKNMRNILLLSYYHLPSHLRTCFLYLSFFPEDCEVDKDCLIWMWIAEGFIKCEVQGISSYEIGENYLNELINRSMIQPMYTRLGVLSKCRVHDMVLEVVRSLSSEENFIVVDGVDHKSPIEKVRRLSLQNGKINHSKTGPTKQVRSVVVFPSAVNIMPPLKNFTVLRVLNLEGCDLSPGYSLEYLGKLHHLRYLGLRDTGITQLPVEIGNLQLLQTLDIVDNEIASLPSTILHLRNLMRLLIDYHTRMPNGMRRLRSLEELSCVKIEDSNMDIVEELGYLTKLRVLSVWIDTRLNETVIKRYMVESLQKLQKLQTLSIWIHASVLGNLDGWVIGPRHLSSLAVPIDRGPGTEPCIWFSTLPAWIDPSKLVDLWELEICVRRLQPEGLDSLGRLPSLRRLVLTVDQIIGGLVAGAGSFPRLLKCEIEGDAWPVEFHEGAAPLLEVLQIRSLMRAVETAGTKDFGLGNLPSIQAIVVELLRHGGAAGEEEAEDLMAALRHAADIHPNCPCYRISLGRRVVATGLGPLQRARELGL